MWCAGRCEGSTSTSVGVLGGRRRQEQDSIYKQPMESQVPPKVPLWNVETSGTVTHQARDSRMIVCEPREILQLLVISGARQRRPTATWQHHLSRLLGVRISRRLGPLCADWCWPRRCFTWNILLRGVELQVSPHVETSPLQCMTSRAAEGDLRAGAPTIKRSYGRHRSGDEDNEVSLNKRVIVTSPCARCGNVQSHHVR